MKQFNREIHQFMFTDYNTTDPSDLLFLLSVSLQYYGREHRDKITDIHFKENLIIINHKDIGSVNVFCYDGLTIETQTLDRNFRKESLYRLSKKEGYSVTCSRDDIFTISFRKPFSEIENGVETYIIFTDYFETMSEIKHI